MESGCGIGSLRSKMARFRSSNESVQVEVIAIPRADYKRSTSLLEVGVSDEHFSYKATGRIRMMYQGMCDN